VKWSFLEHHVTPENAVNDALLMGHCREGVGVVSPKDFGHLLWQLNLPLHFFPHGVKYHDLTAV